MDTFRLPFAGAVAALLFAGACGAAEPVKLDKPVPVSTVKADKKPLDGRLVSYDDVGFDLVRGRDKPVRVRWDELAAPGVYNVRAAIIGPRAGGEEWVELGRLMLRTKGGDALAERAFARAVKLDPNLRAKVEEAKTESASAVVVKSPDDGGGPTEPTTRKGGDEAAGGGPQMVGKAQSGAWPKLTDQQQAERVADLKKFAEAAAKRMNKPLVLQETKYFLFYSDLPPQEAANWSGLLDRMYARLAELFAVEREKPAAEATRPTRSASRGGGDFANVWAGKALVFVFQSADDYRRFQFTVHNTDPGGSAGMCHCFGDGIVLIAFYRQQDELTFAHVLVHESVHGFIHRFRTPATVPSWANEGLAEVIAAELVPRNGRAKQREAAARESLRNRPQLGGMVEQKHIEAWQYPVAETLCAFMIQQNKSNYVDFITGIKDGLTWEQSLEQRYKAPKDRLVAAYRQSLGLKN
jgi:hypothetical protein